MASTERPLQVPPPPSLSPSAAAPTTTSISSRLTSSGSMMNNAVPINLVNRAGQSYSPYVRAHADDLVAWQLWDDEMMELANKSSRVVFLSIGYSACHWCHVMQRESFSNPAIANLLNNHFIPVKVDREQRPDLDRIYNTYVQATTGRGGWPLNVFLTPDRLRPMFGGTYWPPGRPSMSNRNNNISTGATGGATGGGTGNAAAGVGSVQMKPTHLSASGPNASVGLAAFGFESVLSKMIHVWGTQQARCLSEANTIVDHIRNFAHEGLVSREGLSDNEEGDVLELDLLEQARAHFASKFDREFGGFGLSGKFLVPAKLRFLLGLGGMERQVVTDVVGDTDAQKARSMAITTLKNMWRGGIKDQIGYGFARHSVQRDWSVPNFEKMLYDQAQLLNVYMDAFIVSKDPELLDAIKDLIKYLTTAPIANPEGGFFASEDSDSISPPPISVEKEQNPAASIGASKLTPIAIPISTLPPPSHNTLPPSDLESSSAFSPDEDSDVPKEGAFYVWTTAEILQVLGPTIGPLFTRYYSCLDYGNIPAEFDRFDELYGQNVLSITHSPSDSLASLARESGMTVEETEKTLMGARKKLRLHREASRKRPTLDDKIVLAWNGLAMGALARAGIVLWSVGDESSSSAETAEQLDKPFTSNTAAASAAASAASKTMEFIKKEMWDSQTGKLTRIWRQGNLVNKDLAFADDYACLISGLIDVYEATGKSSILEWVEQLQKKQIELFWDSDNYGFFATEANQKDIILRLKDGMDTAEPSTNGMSARNLYRLSSLLNDPSYAKRARQTLHAFEVEIQEVPQVFLGLLEVVVSEQLGIRSVVVSGSVDDEKLEAEIKKLWTGGMNVCRTVARVGKGVEDEYLLTRNTELKKAEETGTASISYAENSGTVEVWNGARAE